MLWVILLFDGVCTVSHCVPRDNWGRDRIASPRNARVEYLVCGAGSFRGSQTYDMTLCRSQFWPQNPGLGLRAWRYQALRGWVARM